MFAPRRVARTDRRSVPLMLGLVLAGGGACTTENPATTEQVTTASTSATPTNNVDILFMVDNSSSMTAMQQKMLAEFPVFIQTLSAIPGGLPSIHLAVISSDLGAPSDEDIGCSLSGDGGHFFVQPQGTCTATTLQPGATFITDDALGVTKNFSAADPNGLSQVFQCIGLLGSNGCGFEHQLSSVARALGADGSPAPDGNSLFLRPDAVLAIVMLTNEDDCSAPASNSPLPIYSLNGAFSNDLSTPGGPLGNYRCNGGPFGGHLCKDPTGPDPTALLQPPLVVPADAVGYPPVLELADCESDDSGSSELTSVSSLVAGIKALKGPTGPAIVVGAIMAPSTPYVVQWTLDSRSDELFPNVEHSCLQTDGSFGDPPVRIAQFIQAFGDDGVTQSICDSSYAPAFSLIASKISAHLSNPGPGPGSDGGTTAIGGASGHPDGGAGTNGPGSAGTNGHGSAGTSGQGATSGSAGTSGQGSGGTSGQGATSGSAGTNGQGSGGTNGQGATSGGAGTNGQGGALSGGGGTKGSGGAPASGSGGAPDGGLGGLGKGSGCDCGVGGSPQGGWSFPLLLGLLLARRNRRRR